MPFLDLVSTAVYDAAGNNNNHLDPGESVNLTATLKNIGGLDLENLSSTLQTSDPFITISDNSTVYGALPVDSVKENLSDPFTLTADINTPEAYKVFFSLITTNAGANFVDTFYFNIVIGDYHYLVWDPDLIPSSGPLIDSILTALGYTGMYSTTLPIDDIDLFKAVFVCAGVYGSNYIINEYSPEAAVLVNYLGGEGRVYLEGGNVWYADPLAYGGYDFNLLFGINALDDGGEMMPIFGLENTFTQGMSFSYGGENVFMDIIEPDGSEPFLIFKDSAQVGRAVAWDAMVYRTVGSAFELGGLTDGLGVSTRAALLDSIMHFFGISGTGISKETSYPAEQDARLSLIISPNVTRTRVNIAITVEPGGKDPELKIFDATGRLTKDLLHTAYSILPTDVSWDGTDSDGNKAPAGVYFVRLQAGSRQRTAKIILVR